MNYAASFFAILSMLSSTVAQRRAAQEVYWSAGAEPVSLDPTKQVDGSSASWLGHLYEGLLTYDAKGNLVPATAESFTVSDDKKVYTFKIRKTAKWHDGKPVRAHCQVTGKMFERVSPVDGKNYAIGFEMRLPNDWNGRFFYQANGGIDGSVVTATGAVNGGGGLDNALNMGFAVISSDAGHEAAGGPTFGIDPQARLDFGYQAAAKLTPMAKSAIQTAYGKAPDRSYFGGCSNGGRHTLVAATRMPDQYDGYLVGAPGFNLPKAAIANIAGAQIYASLASTP